MWAWLKMRIREPTTMIGLATVVAGAGQVAKISEAPQIADAIAQSAGPIATGDYVSGGALLIGGILGAFMREKGDK